MKFDFLCGNPTLGILIIYTVLYTVVKNLSSCGEVFIIYCGEVFKTGVCAWAACVTSNKKGPDIKNTFKRVLHCCF